MWKMHSRRFKFLIVFMITFVVTLFICWKWVLLKVYSFDEFSLYKEKLDMMKTISLEKEEATRKYRLGKMAFDVSIDYDTVDSYIDEERYYKNDELILFATRAPDFLPTHIYERFSSWIFDLDRLAYKYGINCTLDMFNYYQNEYRDEHNVLTSKAKIQMDNYVLSSLSNFVNRGDDFYRILVDEEEWLLYRNNDFYVALCSFEDDIFGLRFNIKYYDFDVVKGVIKTVEFD